MPIEILKHTNKCKKQIAENCQTTTKNVMKYKFKQKHKDASVI